MPEFLLSAPTDLAAVAGRWQRLQAVADGSFFQSWNWVGCLAEERFPDPLLLEAREHGTVVAMALFNRRAGWRDDVLWLGESGDAALDSVFVEHNGPLIATGQPDGLRAACLAAALNAPGARTRRTLVLSGIDDRVLEAARTLPAALRPRQPARNAPWVDLTRLGGDYLDSLGANTRYQLRRSARRYAAEGPLSIERATTVAEAQAFLDGLAALHQGSWTARGRPGAFAAPAFLRFHRALVERAMPAGEIDLLRIRAGDRAIGYLYNFRFRNRACSYQSGFDYELTHPHQKPGLTCHHLAIEMYLREGVAAYDLLAGADRYKTSLANAERELHWVELTRHPGARFLLDRLRGRGAQPV